MVAAIPAQLTDPYWKRIESAAGVSNTGVGKLLRDAKPLYDKFAAALAKIEQHKGANAGEAAKPQNDAAKALLRVAAAVGQAETKVKDAKKKSILTVYKKFVQEISGEIGKFELDDHRGFNTPLSRYNERVPMWAKWVTEQTKVKLK